MHVGAELLFMQLQVDGMAVILPAWTAGRLPGRQYAIPSTCRLEVAQFERWAGASMTQPVPHPPPAALHSCPQQRLFSFLAGQLKASTCYGFTASATNAICTGGNSARYEFCTCAT